MAKKIRFPLQMNDGAAVRTLEELREHFDLESVLGYFVDGKLKTWLTDRYYDELAQKVDGLSADTPDLNAELCEIFGVEYSSDADDTDFEALQRRNEKLRFLREVTYDQQILNNVDAVAFDQDELFDILDDAPSVIYLYGEKFSIPYAKGGITYIGVNNPVVSLEKKELEYKKNGILLQRIRFANKSDVVSIELAEELYEEERYDEALPLFVLLAEDGNPDAQYYLGLMYEDGDGVEQDDKIALEWYQKAAEQGNPNAQNNLGVMYEYGLGIEQDYEFAIKWYQKAAEQGNEIAQRNLGEMYKEGLGIDKDYERSVKWFRKAAKQGDAEAQKLLGDMYYNGKGVDHSVETAAEWYQKAAEQENISALLCLAEMYLDGYGVPMDISKSIEYYEKAAELGDKEAQHTVEIIDTTNEYISAISRNSDYAYDTDALQNNTEILESRYSFQCGLKAIGLIDLSIGKNGKSGFLFTTEGFNWKAPLTNVFVRYQSIRSIEMKRKNLIIHGCFMGESSDELEIFESSIDTFMLNTMIEKILRL